MTDWVAEESQYVFQNYGRQPVVFERGEGTRIWDVDGNEYLDFVGGVAVNILGHSHPVVAQAIQIMEPEQVEEMVEELFMSSLQGIFQAQGLSMQTERMH